LNLAEIMLAKIWGMPHICTRRRVCLPANE
jgi:hypothetical protein